MPKETNPLNALSDAMADAVAKAAAATLMVNARRRFPASGIAYASDLVLTANHVVEREDDIQVGLPDGSQLAANLAGRDLGSDLAVLRLERKTTTMAEAAPGDAQVGQLVLALGRPTLEGIQASLGIISAIGGPVRTGGGWLLQRYLQTDATPYPGFSGGPLIDTAGRVIGINTSGLARGAALTIPATLAWSVASTLAAHGRVRRGFLGVRSQPVSIPAAQQRVLGREQASGLLLVSVEEHSPAEKGGLLIGDIIVALDGKAISDPDELLAVLIGDVVGKVVTIEVIRAGQVAKVAVTIEERRD